MLLSEAMAQQHLFTLSARVKLAVYAMPIHDTQTMSCTLWAVCGLQPSVLQTACSGVFGLPIACCPVPLDLGLCKSVTVDQHAPNNKLLRLETRIQRLFAYRIL